MEWAGGKIGKWEKNRKMEWENGMGKWEMEWENGMEKWENEIGKWENGISREK